MNLFDPSIELLQYSFSHFLFDKGRSACAPLDTDWSNKASGHCRQRLAAQTNFEDSGHFILHPIYLWRESKCILSVSSQ